MSLSTPLSQFNSPSRIPLLFPTVGAQVQAHFEHRKHLAHLGEWQQQFVTLEAAENLGVESRFFPQKSTKDIFSAEEKEGFPKFW